MASSSIFNRRDALLAGASLIMPNAAAASVDTVTIEESRILGRDAFTISNDRLALSILPGGGFIGDVHLLTANSKTNVNPLRVPEYQTIDPYAFDLARDGSKYGTGIQRQLMSGYMGHFTCFPQFGASQEEFAASGYGQHGELIISKWKREVSTAANELLMSSQLPLNQYNFYRSITVLPGETVAYVRETAENLMRYQRAFQWVQHVTMGPPFAEIGRMWVDGSVESTRTGRERAGSFSPWPNYSTGNQDEGDRRAFSGEGAIWLMQREKKNNWLAAYNQNLNILFGHIYDAQINPWVLDWQSNRHQDAFPIPGSVVARGLCWGNSPVATGIKGAVDQGRIADIPVFGWIDPLGHRSQAYAVFITETPLGWRGTADVKAENGAISIYESDSERIITLKAERA